MNDHKSQGAQGNNCPYVWIQSKPQMRQINPSLPPNTPTSRVRQVGGSSFEVQLLGAQTPAPCYCQLAESSGGSADMSSPSQAAPAAREVAAAHYADRPRLLASRCACARPSRASGASLATSGDSWLWTNAIDGWKCDVYTPLSGLQECLQPGDSPAGRSSASLPCCLVLFPSRCWSEARAVPLALCVNGGTDQRIRTTRAPRNDTAWNLADVQESPPRSVSTLGGVASNYRACVPSITVVGRFGAIERRLH